MRALFVGRFQPPHRGHVSAVRAGARRFDQLLVGVGSSQYSHQPQNPFTLGERFDLLLAALRDAHLNNVHLYPIPDIHRHAKWVEHVERILPPFDVVLSQNPLTKKLFTAAGYRVEPVKLWRPNRCSGSMVRAQWLRGDDAVELVPASVLRILRKIGGIERVRAMADHDSKTRRRAPH